MEQFMEISPKVEPSLPTMRLSSASASLLVFTMGRVVRSGISAWSFDWMATRSWRLISVGVDMLSMLGLSS